MFIVLRRFGFYGADIKFIGCFDNIDSANEFNIEAQRKDNILRLLYKYKEYLEESINANSSYHFIKTKTEDCISAYIDNNGFEVIDYEKYYLIITVQTTKYIKQYGRDFHYSFFNDGTVITEIKEVKFKLNEYSFGY